MGLIKDKTLAKLTITAYRDRELRNRVGRLTANYNPETLNLSYAADYRGDNFVNSERQRQSFHVLRPANLSLALLFDTSLPGPSQSVDAELAELRRLCILPDPLSEEPCFLKVEWGKLNWGGLKYFAGRMTSLSIAYLLFERSGEPIRATVSIALAADEALSRLGAPAPATSVPDMSAPAGSLPAAYSLGADYLELARRTQADTLAQIDEPCLAAARDRASW